MRYEGYGPGGAAVVVDCAAQEQGRDAGIQARGQLAAELRRLFALHGGYFGAPGAVSYLFNEVGLLRYASAEPGDVASRLSRAAWEAGAEDAGRGADNVIEVITDPRELAAVRARLGRAGYAALSAQVIWRAATCVELQGEAAQAMRGLLRDLSHHPDVRSVYSNARFTDQRLASF